MKTMTMILYLYGLSAAAAFMMYFAPADQMAGGIPDESIRIRVVAHSDSQAEQERKETVHQAIAKEINNWARTADSAEESRIIVGKNLKEIEKVANAAAGTQQSVHVTFGQEDFPVKQYGRFFYPPGTYESLVVTIGDGKGANWWCILYPALCFPEEQKEQKEETELKWAFVDLWGQLQD
jgi:stage II sporulation protein R